MEAINFIDDRLDVIEKRLEEMESNWQYDCDYDVYAAKVDCLEEEQDNLQKIRQLLKGK